MYEQRMKGQKRRMRPMPVRKQQVGWMAAFVLMAAIIGGGLFAMAGNNEARADGQGTEACQGFDVGSVGTGPEDDSYKTYTAESGSIVSDVCIKSGSVNPTNSHSGPLSANGFYDANFDPSDEASACFLVEGLGTATVTVSKVNNCSGGGVSHLDVFLGDEPEPPRPY